MNSKFIATEDFDLEGGSAEKLVWDKVKESFSGRECIAYSRYPLFSQIGQVRKEPDILIIDKKLGLTIIEVKGISIENIDSINGSIWNFNNFYQQSGSPYEQAQRQMRSLLARTFVEPKLFGCVISRVLVALPYITREEWKERGFHQNPSCPPIIFRDDLVKTSLFNCVNDAQLLQYGEELDDEAWNLLLSTLTGETNLIKEDNNYYKEGTKAYVLDKVESELHDIDFQQESIGKIIPPGPQRIRGIAGSGKTLLLCEKAAQMHLKHPDWNIAFVFFTRTLYDSIIKTIDMWVRYFTNGQNTFDGNNSNLQVLHAWGAKNRTGLYREICNQNFCTFFNANDVKDKIHKFSKPNEFLAYACRELLNEKNNNIRQVYDAILIDEGQDLVVGDNFKFEGRQPFYWMAYQALKPVNPLNYKLRRLIWAYDEAQRLDGYEIPTAQTIFGDDPEFREMFSRSYKGGIKKTEVMRKCYRTPAHILTTAHAIGMGLLREEGMICGFTTKEDWENIGYEVERGNFRVEGNRVILRRPTENSPNIVKKYYDGRVITFETYTNFNEVQQQLEKDIRKDIEEEMLNPSRNIMVIALGDPRDSKRLEESVAAYLINKNIDIYIPTSLDKNIVSHHWKDEDRDKFWHEGAVTISRIHRAKGNEAAMVYIIGLENVAKNESDIGLRNQLFVALTRAKCWVKVFGIDEYAFYDEFNKCIEANGVFDFNFKRPHQDINDLQKEEIQI